MFQVNHKLRVKYVSVSQEEEERTSLPLYTEAIKFFNHRDGMVRAAVRTLTLQTFALEDPGIQKFLVSQPASNFLNEVAIIIAEQCQVCCIP
jgi:hypothetical protein